LSLYAELKRRNVFKAAIVYIAVAWLLLQVSDTLAPALHLPGWFVSAVALLLMLGFPIAIVLAWAFDLTPEGVKRDSKADPAAPGAGKSNRKLNHIVVAALVLALSYFVIDKIMLAPGRDTATTSSDVQLTRQQASEIEPDKTDNSIAVLPFVNMSSEEEQEYFSDGLSEELLNLLARIPELNVAARTSSFSFKNKDLAIPEIASQLKVAHILEGSVRKHGNRIRITAQLVQADNGYHLWSDTYDRQLDDVFQIQEEIAVAVVDALKITLLGEAPQTRRADPQAYQLFLEGQYLKRQISTESLNRAVEAFRQSVEIDPAYVPAWAELADTYIWGGGSDKFSHQERWALADQAIQTSINTDPDYAFGYYVRGISWIFTKHNFKEGIEDFEHALALDPDDAFLVAAIGKGALLTGNFDLAISQYRAALAMEPVVPEFYFFIGRAYLTSGRLDDAEASFRKLSTLSPSFRADFHLFETLFEKGELEAALAALDTRFTRAVTHHALGDTAEADEALADLIENADPYELAMAHGYRGEVDKAFEQLDYMLENSDYYPTFILVETAFASMHSDPQWEALLEKLDLLEFWLAMKAKRERRNQGAKEDPRPS
jgi:TolB-like protein